MEKILLRKRIPQPLLAFSVSLISQPYLSLSPSPPSQRQDSQRHIVQRHTGIFTAPSPSTHPSHTSMHSTHACFNKKGLTQSTVAIKTSSDYSPRLCRDSGLERLAVHCRPDLSVSRAFHGGCRCVLETRCHVGD